MTKRDYSDWEIEDLIKRIKGLEKRKKYGLVWDEESTKEEFEEETQGKLPVLVEDKSKEIHTDDERPTHILIEGDNYHALSVLNYTHEGKIDVIYIDPPYNTGKKKEWKYNDKWVDKEDAYRHSKWLSFMEKRIYLAKNLLNTEGFIFVSIDDNELYQLKLLLDQIFGEKNFIALFIHKNNSSKNQANLVSVSTEYLLLYSNNIECIKEKKTIWRVTKKGVKDIVRTYKKLKDKGLSIEEIIEEIKDLYKRPKYSHLSRWNKADEKGVFKDADLSREGGPKDFTIINPITGRECVIPNRGWGKNHEELLRLQAEDLIWYGDDDTPPGEIDYLTLDDKSVPDSFLYYDNSKDTRLIKEMFGSLIFKNPKPLDLMKLIIEMASDENSIILDFFAGSGTTGHAVLNLNKQEVRGKRQFILCTNNENQIMEEVCYPRVCKVMQGYTNSKGEAVKGLGGNLIYFKTAFVSGENTDSNRKLITERSVEMLCLKEDTYKEIEKTDDWQIYKNNARYTAILFEPEAITNFRERVEGLDKPVSVYVFSLTNDTYTEAFEGLEEKVTLCAVPESILKVYRRIYQ